MKGISRKQFVTLCGSAIAATLVLQFAQPIRAAAETRQIRILPIPGKRYSPSFLKFCETARFETVAAALGSVRNPRIEFKLAYVVS